MNYYTTYAHDRLVANMKIVPSKIEWHFCLYIDKKIISQINNTIIKLSVISITI